MKYIKFYENTKYNTGDWVKIDMDKIYHKPICDVVKLVKTQKDYQNVKTGYMIELNDKWKQQAYIDYFSIIRYATPDEIEDAEVMLVVKKYNL